MGLLQDGCFVGDTDGEEQEDFFFFLVTNLRGKGVEELWERARLLSSLCSSVSSEFRDLTFFSISLNWKGCYRITWLF